MGDDGVKSPALVGGGDGVKSPACLKKSERRPALCYGITRSRL